MKILIDMNLSPSWVPALERKGWSAVHWSDVGDPRAVDRAIMDWAADHGHVVFTHDLDFGTMPGIVIRHGHPFDPASLVGGARDVRLGSQGTVVEPFDTSGPLFRDTEIAEALASRTEDGLFGNLILRGLVDE